MTPIRYSTSPAPWVPGSILYKGECLQVLRTLPSDSVSCVITDPQYGLSDVSSADTIQALTAWASGDRERVPDGRGMMSLTWDRFVPPPAVWDECYRVLKPGAFMAVFAGSRMVDLAGLSIRLAGFEIRDNISYAYASLVWYYGSGFPKSKAVTRDPLFCQCMSNMLDPITEKATESAAQILLDEMRGHGKENTGSVADLHGMPVGIYAGNTASDESKHDLLSKLPATKTISNDERPYFSTKPENNTAMRSLRNGCESISQSSETVSSSILFSQLSIKSSHNSSIGEQVRSDRENRNTAIRCKQSSMERRDNLQTPERQLHRPSVRSMSERPVNDGTQRWLYSGTSTSDGSLDRTSTNQNRMCESYQSQPAGQLSFESRAISDERGSQTWRGWPLCPRCGKSRLPRGLGTALKPAHEPIIVARKPFNGTIAHNLLKHGTGGINIDGCRVPIRDRQNYEAKCASVVGLDSNRNGATYGEWSGTRENSANAIGRWPANVVLSHSEHCDMETCVDGCPVAELGKPAKFYNVFRYQAKAPKSERPVVDGVAHPTVKPRALAEWLITLFTPPYGVVLDPFTGSGTVGEAALRLGFNSIIIERDKKYWPLIDKRLNDYIDTAKVKAS
jgi:DNA modification methylase